MALLPFILNSDGLYLRTQPITRPQTSIDFICTEKLRIKWHYFRETLAKPMKRRPNGFKWFQSRNSYFARTPVTPHLSALWQHHPTQRITSAGAAIKNMNSKHKHDEHELLTISPLKLCCQPTVQPSSAFFPFDELLIELHDVIFPSMCHLAQKRTILSQTEEKKISFVTKRGMGD